MSKRPASKAPKLEPARLFYYADHLQEYMAREDWRWNGYQCLIYFVRKRKEALGDFGDYNIKRDEGILRQARDSLLADGITITQGIDVFFSDFRGVEFVRANGMTVPIFKSQLAKIKQLARKKLGKGPSAPGMLATERPPLQACCKLCEVYRRWIKYRRTMQATYGKSELKPEETYCAGDGFPFTLDEWEERKDAPDCVLHREPEQI